ncbi:DUF3152 domain-containing protein [Cellulomonas fulva]|uniref:DUF3152 domain-containing protein n=1 Tax=Cellulomonas fulva TaxID=2835530 RepID=UPI0027DC4567|nr:DUF3152 domain-containing protein [Cellulomonas fulva]
MSEPEVRRTGDQEPQPSRVAARPRRSRRPSRGAADARSVRAVALVVAAVLLGGAAAGVVVHERGDGSDETAGAGPSDAGATAPVSSPARTPDPTPTLTPAPTPAPTPTLAPSAPPAPTPTPTGLPRQDRDAGLLSDDVPESASGDLVVVPGSDPGPGTGAVHSVRVEVEDGLDVDAEVFADFVMSTLNDPRGWGADGSLSFARTDEPAEIRVVLASPDLTDAMCAPLLTRGEVSCGRGGHATINFRRWVEAIPEYGNDRWSYRRYVVNHEVGHLLGHPHEQCPGAGELAPVMHQQSYGVAPCVPNPWPALG